MEVLRARMARAEATPEEGPRGGTWFLRATESKGKEGPA